MQLGKDGCLEGLTQLQAHLTGLTVPMWSPLAFACTEGRRTILTVHQGPVRQGSCPGAPDLGEEGHMSQAHSCQLTLHLPLARALDLTLLPTPPTSISVTQRLYLQNALREGPLPVSKPPSPLRSSCVRSRLIPSQPILHRSQGRYVHKYQS